MATIDVKDASGATVALEKPLTPGRAAAAASRPVVLSTEDLAAVGATNETAPATDTASSGLNGRLQRIAQRITSLIALIPAALTAAGNFKVAISERVFGTTKGLTNANVSFSSSGENTVVSGTASQTIRVFRLYLTPASVVTMTVKDAAGGTTLATLLLQGGQPFAFDVAESEPMWVTATSGAFVISLSSAVAVTGFIQYTKSA